MRKLSVLARKLESLASIPLGAAFSGTVDKHRLSGDSFARMADLALYRKSPIRTSHLDLRDVRIVFIANHDVERFVDEYINVLRPKVLIIGDGDRDWPSFEFPELAFVKRIFLQNSSIPNDYRFRCLPIGLENRKYGRNGMPYNFCEFYAKRVKTSGVFMGPLGNTHPIREQLVHLELAKLDNFERIDERISSVEFAARSSRWSHVLSPRGNGKDTHRFWETLYRGSIPVVTDDQWSRNISSYGIPLETVTEWTTSEIERVASSPKAMPRVPESIPALWKSFWIEQIKEVC